MQRCKYAEAILTIKSGSWAWAWGHPFLCTLPCNQVNELSIGGRGAQRAKSLRPVSRVFSVSGSSFGHATPRRCQSCDAWPYVKLTDAKAKGRGASVDVSLQRPSDAARGTQRILGPGAQRIKAKMRRLTRSHARTLTKSVQPGPDARFFFSSFDYLCMYLRGPSVRAGCGLNSVERTEAASRAALACPSPLNDPNELGARAALSILVSARSNSPHSLIVYACNVWLPVQGEQGRAELRTRHVRRSWPTEPATTHTQGHRRSVSGAHSAAGDLAF